MLANEGRLWPLLDLGWFSDSDKGGEPPDEGGAEEASNPEEIEDEEVEQALVTEEINVDDVDDPAELKSIIKQIDDENRQLSSSNKKLASLARERLHEIMEKKNKLKALQDEQDEKKLAELKEKEQYKAALDRIEPQYEVLKSDAAKTVAFFEEEFSELKEELPEEYHHLIPDGDIRQRIAWIRKFKKTVVEKAAPSVETPAPAPGKKRSVGGADTPPEKPPGTRPDVEKIEQAIQNASSPAELEAIVSGVQSAVR